MDRQTFIHLYKALLEEKNTAYGFKIIESFIEEEGNETHIQCKDLFMNLVHVLAPLYKHCLEYAVGHYISKYSVVIITKTDPYIGEQLITIY